MIERVRHLPGHALDLDGYNRDFAEHWEQIQDVFWKLERIQTFREPGEPSWEAWISGGWDEALAVMDADRAALSDEYLADVASGMEFRRLRIVEFPVSHYLQWELHALRIRAAQGEQIRVLDAAKCGHLEARAPLPELTILGIRAMYEILYDDTGTLCGGRRLTDPDVIRACRSELTDLYQQAEDFASFFQREIAPLPAPVPDRV